jgi:hypothetical protein
VLGLQERAIARSVAVAVTIGGVGRVKSFCAGVVTDAVAAGEKFPFLSKARIEYE